MIEGPLPATMDFVVHNRTFVAARPASIWPQIATLAWLDSPSLVSIAGRPGDFGERFEAYADPSHATLLYHLENIELVPEERRTMRIDLLDGSWAGFVTFGLIDLGEHTLVAYDVDARWPTPPGEAPQVVLAQARKGGEEILLRLKTLIEQADVTAMTDA